MASIVRGDHGHVLRDMCLIDRMSAFHATTHYRDDLCALRQSQKVLRVLSTRRDENPAVLCNSCELAPAVLSPPPCQPYRNNRLRSHPQHFASTAFMPTPPPPQSIKVLRRIPTTPPFVQTADCVLMPHRTLRRNTGKAAILIGYTGSFNIH